MKPLALAILLVLATIRTAAAQSAAGDWEGTLDTPGAQVPFKVSFTVRGDTLGGTVKRSSGDVALTGRVKGDSVIFQYTISYSDNPFTMNLRGVVKGDALAGIVDFGGGTTGPFTARRIPPKP